MSIRQIIKDHYWVLDHDSGERLHSVRCKPFENELPPTKDPKISDAILSDNRKWVHEEFVVRLKNVVVEPQFAFVMTGMRKIAECSIRVDYRPPMPSPFKAVRSYLSRTKSRLPKAILFDGTLSGNYFHFLIDAIPKIFLLSDHVDISLPILVGPKTFAQPQFQFLIQNTSLRELNWVKIENPYEVDELFVAQPLPYRKEFCIRTKELLIPQDLNLSSARTIFVNRKGNRSISNFDDLLPVLKEFNIDIVDPGKMTISDQAKVFNTASRIIGIHGAALANLLFTRKSGVKMLELCSESSIRTQYYWLSTTLGIEWEMLLGGPFETDQCFRIDPNQFRNRLVSFLAS